MTDKTELARLRQLSLDELERAEGVLELAAYCADPDEFDRLTIDAAMHLNALSRLYADLADSLGTARFSERGEARRVLRARSRPGRAARFSPEGARRSCNRGVDSLSSF